MNKNILAGFTAFALSFILFACKDKTGNEQVPSVQQSVPEIKSILINGDSLHYIDIGKGDPVVFVHGSIGDYRAWEMQMDTFAKDHRVIAYSRRYAYPNKQIINDTADYSVAIHAKDLTELIKSLGIGPVHLVGHSYGAYTSLLATIEHPELVKSLTLGEPPVMPLLQYVPGGDTILRNFMDRAFRPAGETFKSGNDEKAVAIFIGGVMGDSTFYSKIPAEARSSFLENTLELRGSSIAKDPFTKVTCDQLKQLKTPSLIITGERSPLLFVSINDQLNKCLPNKETATIPNATHGLQTENPVDFNKIVLAFINKH